MHPSFYFVHYLNCLQAFKFNCAHFVAYKGFRERLHGHNYKLGIRLLGSRTIGQDGYLLDFGDLKAAAKQVCKKLNELFICPIYSDVITITKIKNGKYIQLVCEDGAEFSFPIDDCAMLPIVHSTVEEIGIYCWGQILLLLDASYLVKRGIHTMEITCSEATGQEAVFRKEIPDTNDTDEILKVCDVKSYITTGELFPRPCHLHVPENAINSNPQIAVMFKNTFFVDYLKLVT